MKNESVAATLEEIAGILEIQDADRFKIRSYLRASQSVRELTSDIKKIALEGKLTDIPGVGKSIAEKIQEYLKTGKIGKLEELKKEVPEGLLKMLNVPGLGPSRVKTIHDKLGIKDMRGLEIALRRGDLASLPGFGEKTQRNIKDNLEIAMRSSGRMLVSTASAVVDDFSEWLSKNRNCKRYLACGSWRRGCETVGDIDMLAVSAKPEELIAEFTKRDCVEKVLAGGTTKGSIVTDRKVQVDLRAVDAGSWGSASMYFTGSKQHNVHLREFALKKGFTLNEYGLYKIIKNKKLKMKDENQKKYAAGRTEEEVYSKLGLQFIPPEMREDSGEIEAASENRIPKIVELKDIKGDLHIHSTFSDGNMSIAEIAQRARELKYQWVAVCDHSQSLKIANGLSIETLEKKKREIDRLNKKTQVRILLGAEVDILPDGTLDYPDEVLKKLDVCIGALHSAFGQSAEVMNARIMKAMDNPHLDIIAHPTARLIGKRPPLPVDIEMLVKKAKEKNIVLEVNCFPDRLDLKDTHCRMALAEGVKLSLGSDSHSLYHMDNMKYGLKNLRRAWANKADVINTMGADKLIKFIKDRRKGCVNN